MAARDEPRGSHPRELHGSDQELLLLSQASLAAAAAATRRHRFQSRLRCDHQRRGVGGSGLHGILKDFLQT